MGGFKEPSLAERQASASKIKKAALDRFRQISTDPAAAATRAERATAKRVRDAERAEKKLRDAKMAEEAARLAAEKATRELAEKHETEAAKEVARKAERDRRYAARKARQK